MKSSIKAKACVAREAPPILRIADGSKEYRGTYVLEDVNFEVYASEVHALLGENGAGKSTLAQVIAGAVPLTSGSLTIDGEAKQFRSPADSLRAGVAMVYQESSLIPPMTVAQNLLLGREPWINRSSSIHTAARQMLRSLNFNVDPCAVVERLGPAQRQMVEIARAAHLNARVIIFDEPTASLSPAERHQFFDLLRTLRHRGLGLVFITHAIEEALRVSDRITVLRDGKRVTCAPAAELDRQALIRLIVGRSFVNSRDARSVTREGTRGEKVLSVERVSMGVTVKDMSFSLYAGEVVGIIGPIGSGRSEIAKIVAGILKRNRVRGGMIRLRGKPVRYREPVQAIRDGIVYVTEDRKLNGFFETMTVDDNIYLSSLTSRHGWRFLYSRTARTKIADYWIEKLSIKASNASPKLSEYSGGNQQKIVIAKGLAQEPDVLFFDEPTRGVDVGAISQIHEIIQTLAREGKAVVVISSYLPEVLSISNRVLVARNGRIVAEFDSISASEDKIVCAAVR